jgi:hypothetical protein
MEPNHNKLVGILYGNIYMIQSQLFPYLEIKQSMDFDPLQYELKEKMSIFGIIRLEECLPPFSVLLSHYAHTQH